MYTSCIHKLNEGTLSRLSGLDYKCNICGRKYMDSTDILINLREMIAKRIIENRDEITDQKDGFQKILWAESVINNGIVVEIN